MIGDRTTGAVVAMARHDVDLARDETIQYHQRVYRDSRPNQWLEKPSAFVLRTATRVIDGPGKFRIADLGRGSGRHALTIASRLGPSSEVICLHLVPAAIAALERSARKCGVQEVVRAAVADIEDFDLGVE